MNIKFRAISLVLCVVMLFSIVPLSAGAFGKIGFSPKGECAQHSYEDYIYEPATFSKEGSMKQICSVCGYETPVQAIPRLFGCEIEEWSSIHGLTYNGKNHFPYVYAYADGEYGDISLRNGIDYKVTYPSEDKKVGTYSATVTFMGRYEGTASVKYSVVLGKPSVTAKVGTDKVVLSWSKVAGAQYYRVYGYNIKTGKYTRLANTKSLSYTRTGRTPGTEYAYLVRAYFINKAGKEVLSSYNPDYDNVYCCTLCKAPSAKATVSSKAVTLKWAKCAGASYYRIYKYNTKTKKYTTLVSSTAKLSVKLTNQPKGTNYYLVRAFNSYNLGSKYSTKTLTKAVVKK